MSKEKLTESVLELNDKYFEMKTKCTFWNAIFPSGYDKCLCAQKEFTKQLIRHNVAFPEMMITVNSSGDMQHMPPRP